MTGGRAAEGPDRFFDGEFGLWISMLNRAAAAYFQRELKPIGIGPGQQAYLLAIRPGETIRQDELARRLKVDKANVTRALQRLSGNGFVRRNRPADDGRVWNVSLTEQGLSARGEAERISREWIGKLKRDLPPDEWTRTVQAMKKIALAAHSEYGPLER